jgi:spore coat protein CotH
MKKIIGFIFLINLIVLSIACGFENPEVVFTDINLEMAVREVIAKEEGTIYASSVRRIESLGLFGRGIENLEGLEHFTGLKKLDLEDNFVKDVSPLAGLTKLEWLSLRNNEITSLSEIKFDTLKDLPLTYLSLRHNVVRDAEENQTRISDISLISNFTDLHTLDLRDNQITDISPIRDLNKLTYLDISQNPLSDTALSDLSALVNLTYLNLRQTNASNLEVLRNLTKLTYLNIHSNTSLESLDFLEDLTNLEELVLQNVFVGDNIDVLASLTKLSRINLQNTGITDLSVIATLMADGALQDKALLGIEADVNISSNPLEIEDYQVLAEYWPNIKVRMPMILPSANPTTPFINEFMSSNGDSIIDYYGNNEDWIEIYNPENTAMNIGGYYLSDDFSDITKWSFPIGTTIPARGYLVVFASGLDRVVNGEIHTSFSISRDGEELALTDKDGVTVLDYVQATVIPRNFSYGRNEDGMEQWVFYDLTNTTPNASNDEAQAYVEELPIEFEYNVEEFSRLFNDAISKNIIIQIAESEWDDYDQVMLDYYQQFGDFRTDYYAMADFLYEDEEGQVLVENVGFRTRGNMSRVRIQNDDGSLNMSNFKVSFHETFDMEEYSANKLRRVFNLEELDMKWNRNYDETYLTEKFSLDLMQDFGVHAATTTLANVYIEIGSTRYYYGVYTLYEPIDEEFLEKRFPGEESGGNLYKSLWQQFGPASLRNDYPSRAIGIKDESINYRPTYDLKTNKSIADHSGLKSFISNVSGLTGTDFDEYITANFDVDRFLKYLAVGVLLGNPDDYRAMGNNYYLYNNPVSGKWTIMPYDYDHGMGQGWDGSPVFYNWTVDHDIYTWGNLNAALQGKSYANPLSDKILKIDRYQLQYEAYLKELINPSNNYFTYDAFKILYEQQKNLYDEDLNSALMNMNFGERNIQWYITEKSAKVNQQIAYYEANPNARP